MRALTVPRVLSGKLEVLNSDSSIAVNIHTFDGQRNICHKPKQPLQIHILIIQLTIDVHINTSFDDNEITYE